MSAFRVIVMPYELCRLRAGVGRGPEQLLEAGAVEALGSGGAAVETETLEFEGRFSSEVNTSFDLMRQVSERVRAARDEGAFPVILSGSCFAAVGVVAGLAERAPGVVWLDAHADFNTPDSTVFGYFDGMGRPSSPAERGAACVPPSPARDRFPRRPWCWRARVTSTRANGRGCANRASPTCLRRS